MNTPLAELEKALERNPDSILFARLADEHLKSGAVEEALQVCQEGLERYPFYVGGYLVLGKCYLAAQSFGEARRAFNRALKLYPENLSALWHLSKVYERLGWEVLALNCLRRAAELDPFNEGLRGQIEALTSTLEEEVSEEEEVQRSASTVSEVEDAVEEAHISPSSEEATSVPEDDRNDREMDLPEVEDQMLSSPVLGVDAEVDEEKAVSGPNEEADQRETEEEEEILSEVEDRTLPFPIPRADAEADEEKAVSLPAKEGDQAKTKEEEEALSEKLESTAQEDLPGVVVTDEERSILLSASMSEGDSEGAKGSEPEAASTLEDEKEIDEEESVERKRSERTEVRRDERTGQAPREESISPDKETSSGEARAHEDRPTPNLEETKLTLASQKEEQEQVSGGHLAETTVDRSPADSALSSRKPAQGESDAKLIRLLQEIETQREHPAPDEDVGKGSGGDQVSALDEKDSGGLADATEQDEQIATITLAEIYALQGLTDQAVHMFEQILEEQPENERVKKRLAELKYQAHSEG